MGRHFNKNLSLFIFFGYSTGQILIHCLLTDCTTFVFLAVSDSSWHKSPRWCLPKPALHAQNITNTEMWTFIRIKYLLLQAKILIPCHKFWCHKPATHLQSLLSLENYFLLPSFSSQELLTSGHHPKPLILPRNTCLQAISDDLLHNTFWFVCNCCLSNFSLAVSETVQCSIFLSV